MGLAIDGNVVNGIARGGQAFVPVEQLPQISSDGSITYNGKQYDTKLKVTDYFVDDLDSFMVSGDTDNNKPYLLSAQDLDCTEYFGKKAMLFYTFQYVEDVRDVTATEVFELQKAQTVESCTGDGPVKIIVNPSGKDTYSGFVIDCDSQDSDSKYVGVANEKTEAKMLLLIFN